MTRREQLRRAAATFHGEHPEVWTLFCIYTRDRIARGFEHYGAPAIFERIRWESAKPTYAKGEAFKLNNNHIPFYARRFMRVYPEHEGFFRTRHQISRDVPASTLPELGPRDYL